MSNATIDDKAKVEWVQEHYNGLYELFIDQVAIYDALAKAAAPVDEPPPSRHMLWQYVAVKLCEIQGMEPYARDGYGKYRWESWKDEARDIIVMVDLALAPLSPESDAAPGDTAVSMAIQATAPSTSDEMATEQPDGFPVVNEFRINPLGGDDIEVDGNGWFCHAHEVKAYVRAVKDRMNVAQAAAQPDDFTLLSVLADIRMKTGVGDKPMLSELADTLAGLIQRQSIAQPPAQQSAGVDEAGVKAALLDFFRDSPYPDISASAAWLAIQPHLHPQPAPQEASPLTFLDERRVRQRIADAIHEKSSWPDGVYRLGLREAKKCSQAAIATIKRIAEGQDDF